ncbi:MAG: hypothetical protein AAF078_07985, partial [Planctomycetota bacterium]
SNNGDSTRGPITIWAARLADYTGESAELMQCPSNTDAPEAAGNGFSAGTASALTRVGFGGAVNQDPVALELYNDKGWEFEISYGTNNWAALAHAIPSDDMEAGKYIYSLLDDRYSPSETMAVADAVDWRVFQVRETDVFPDDLADPFNSGGGSDGLRRVAVERHANATNFGMLDGSARTVQTEDMLDEVKFHKTWDFGLVDRSGGTGGGGGPTR